MDDAAKPPDPKHLRRKDNRANTFLSAVLIARDVQIPVTVRNLSPTGALLQARTVLQVEEAVTLARGSLRAHATLVWREGRFGGLKFDAPINIALWIPGAKYEAQLTADRMVAETRGEASVPVRMATTRSPEVIDNLPSRIAEELAFVSRNLELLGNVLSDDATVVARHPSQLQELDLAIQALGHLTRLLDSNEPSEVLKAIGMNDLRRRLERKSLD